MNELSEKQEQEMIEKAKSGDPEANYQMSLWALEQAVAEPEEERWNRLAAKCLVKAAEAGYAPAKEKMEELLMQSGDSHDAPGLHEVSSVQAARDTETAVPAPVSSEAETSSDEKAPAGEKTTAPRGASLASGISGLGGKLKGVFAKSGDSEKKPAEEGDGSKKPGLFNFSQWDSAKWKKMQTVCVVICVILAILLAAMAISGKKKRSAKPEQEIIIPAAEVINTPAPATPSPTPAAYPAEDVKTEIAAAATLTVFPEEGDFVTEATTRTVTTSGSTLNVRSGPNASQNLVTALENNATVDVYAFKNGWALVKVGESWGWCSNDYLK